MKKRILRYLTWLIVLCAGFILCRYALFSLHGMREWPVLLFIAGAVVLTAAFLLKAKYVPIVTALGYPVAFLLGVLLQSNGTDPGGGTTNNLWTIWTVSYFSFITASVLSEFLIKKKR